MAEWAADASKLWRPGIARDKSKPWKGDDLWGWPAGHAGIEGVGLKKLRPEGLRLGRDQDVAQR